MNTEATLLTGKVETPKRALALKLALAICALTALVGAIATPRASGHQVTGLRGADATLAPVDPSGGPLIEVLRTDRTSEQHIVKSVENGVSLEVSETADAICGCDLQTCCDNGFNGRQTVGPLQCDILRNVNFDNWPSTVDFCREAAEGTRNGSSSACEQPEVFDTGRMGITYMIEWDKTCASLDTGYCNKDGMECSGPGTRPFNATCPQGISNPFNLAGPGSHTCMRATHSARAFPLDQIYQISFSHEWGCRAVPGRDNEGIAIWVSAPPYPDDLNTCLDLEPAVYLGPKDDEAIPDDGAIYSECIDFQGPVSGPGRMLVSVATGTGNWPCAFGPTPPPTTESDGAATASAAGAALLGLAAHLV
jgi:hypothetical protein